ncbi:hypothetical protein LB467_08415 [Salegentibacter sp. JZCK2]|uniref:hypothetical protein n=1 Tax=Salegentibacter tibetensis TaxID=2873600 RepID=UPI001CCFA2D1|nr:hypothetical protein [Salegentibacter tibetensis]MBZ9729711.1 hypothetical protein [Salegentibacter tibetensis]
MGSDIFNTRNFGIQTSDAQFSQQRFFNRENRIATLEKEEVNKERYSDDPF